LVSHPGKEHHRISISISGKGGFSGIDLCNPKRSVLKFEGSSSGSEADLRQEGEQGTGVEES
jgi:hypothetical protein